MPVTRKNTEVSFIAARMGKSLGPIHSSPRREYKNRSQDIAQKIAIHGFSSESVSRLCRTIANHPARRKARSAKLSKFKMFTLRWAHMMPYCDTSSRVFFTCRTVANPSSTFLVAICTSEFKRTIGIYDPFVKPTSTLYFKRKGNTNCDGSTCLKPKPRFLCEGLLVAKREGCVAKGGHSQNGADDVPRCCPSHLGPRR